MPTTNAERCRGYRQRRRDALPSQNEWREGAESLLLATAQHPRIGTRLDPVARLLLRLAKWHRISLHEPD